MKMLKVFSGEWEDLEGSRRRLDFFFFAYNKQC